MADQHIWTKEDDSVAFYIARFGVRFLGVGEATIASILSKRPASDGGPANRLSEASLRMRIQNFDHLLGRGGIPNVAIKNQAWSLNDMRHL